MSKFLNFILLSCFFLGFLNGCNRSQSAATNTENTISAKPTLNPNQNSRNTPNKSSPTVINTVDSNAVKSADEDEIKSCLPEKLYRGEILIVKFKQPHGGYGAIRRMSDDRWFFLNYADRSTPVWSVETFKTLAEIKINLETAVSTTNSETPEKIFNQAGKYRIMVSDQDFGQDDPPVTGICEIEYFNEKRPKK